MKLTGALKEKVEMAESREQAREAIREAGMELTDVELDSIAGGSIGGGRGYSVGERPGSFHYTIGSGEDQSDPTSTVGYYPPVR